MINNDTFNRTIINPSKVSIIRYDKSGNKIINKVDYIPIKERYIKGDVIKKLSKKQLKKLSKGKKKGNKKQYNFYRTREWRDLRYRVLRNNNASCMCCGQSPKLNRVILHVDHIKPRSKFPELELAYDNLQILCEACNKGKGNKDEIDWRP